VQSYEGLRKTNPQVFDDEKGKEREKEGKILLFFPNLRKATSMRVIMHFLGQQLTLITKILTTQA